MMDGWHKIAGYDVYIEDGIIIRGLSKDGQKAVYVYRRKKDGWDKEEKITPSAFRAGVARGTIKMF